MKLIAAALWVGLSAAMPACMPIPERAVPEIEGRLMAANGDPMVARTVKRIVEFSEEDVRQGRACERAGDIARTDSDGNFHFDGSWRFPTPLYGDPNWRVLLCVQDNKDTIPSWRAGHIGRTPALITLSCRTESRPGSPEVKCWTEPTSQR